MTHSGGKPHAVGDRGQRYEVRFRFSADGDKHPLGWASTLPGARQMVEGLDLHPTWEAAEVYDRETKSVIPLDVVRKAE